MAVSNGFLLGDGYTDLVSVNPMAWYEQNRLKDTDERDAVQKKTFTKWVNKHLLKAGRRIVDLYEDLKDGHNLISLLEVLAHEVLPRERGHMRFHKIQNVQISLDFLRMKGIRLVNIRSDEIVDGNPKLTLGLIWTIILHFQISDVMVPGQPQDITARDALLLWSRRTVEGYPGVKIQNFSNSWRDGKAFLAIVHRHRPDLVDFRKARHNTNKHNLETAFGLYEREFGVTRLLDPEDVDVPEPDERSVITYVSSLYDVFPEVPSVEQSLRDNECQLKLEEYRELADALLSWLSAVTVMMQNRDFPSNLVEIRALLAEFNRFRMEEIPPRTESRQKLLRLFDEIQSLTSDFSHTRIDEEFLPENINRLWNRFVAAQQERDMALQAEVLRLERLQRLAEKVHREAKYNEDSLSDLERRIAEEEMRVDVIHPFEAKRNCDAIDRALRTVEDNIRSLFRDVLSLQDGRYPQADNLYRRISDLQSRLSQLRTRLYSNVIQRLLSKSYVEEGRTVMKRKEVVTEVRLVETNPAFKHIQDCLDWIEEKQNMFETAEYDSDLSRVQSLIASHQRDHQEVLSFRSQVDRCINDRRSLSAEEQNLYTEKLSKVEVAYSLLLNTSSRRLKCLESLSEFLQTATVELMWLNQKEEAEMSRNWGSHDINITEVEDQHKSLVRQLESRESQFNAVQERGGAMILDRHPASKVVEAYMATMQSQWSWLLQLTACMESHLKHAIVFHQFFDDCRHCEQWMLKEANLLQTRYARENIPGEDSERLLRELKEMQDHLREYNRRISSLVMQSHEVLPLQQRSRPVLSPIHIRALCAHHQDEVSFQKGEECLLLDTSQQVKWKVQTAVGVEAVVPAVCFLIPPPNQEAIDLSNRLKVQLDHLSSLHRNQQRKLRLNMVFATIHIIKGWDLKQFCAMDPSQRDAIWKALQDDADRLFAESDDGDPDMVRLHHELEECNQIFLDLTAKAAALEASRTRTPSQSFLQQLDTVNRNLALCDQQLSTFLHKPLPTNQDTIKTDVSQYQEFDDQLQCSTQDVEVLQKSYLSVTPKTSQVESRLNLVVEKCDQLKAISHIYIQRLKNCELVVTNLDSVKQLVSDYEITLASKDNMTSDVSRLRNQRDELQELQSSIQQQQPRLDSLKRDVVTLRTLVEHSRPGTVHHHDLEAVEKDVEDVGVRWDNVCIQVVERLRGMDTSHDLLSLYQNGLAGEEQWIQQMQSSVQSQPPLSPDVQQAQKLLEPTMGIYNSLGERRHQIEVVNRHGGQYIREAKIYDKRLEHYRDSLEDVDAALIASVCKKVKRQGGAETVKIELDTLNRNYMGMVQWASARLKEITAILSEANVDVQFQMVIDDEIPLLRTFRAELAKRSSMLFDEDMEEFFQQLSEFEGYGNLPTTYYGAGHQTYTSQATLQPGSVATAQPSNTERTVRVSKLGTTSVQIQLPKDADGLEKLSIALGGERQRPKSPSRLLPKSEQKEQTLITVKTANVAPRGTMLHVSAIINPTTQQRVTLVEAIQSGLIDPKLEAYIDPKTKQKIPLSQAVNRGYIDKELHTALTSSSGIHDPWTRTDLSLIEAISKDLYNPISNTIKDPVSESSVSLTDAAARGLISPLCARSLVGEPVSLTSITHTQAVVATSDLVRTEAPLSLTQILDKGLFNKTTGKIVDPISWNEMTILQAVECGLINSSHCEVEHPVTGRYITLTEAVSQGIVDPMLGTYKDSRKGNQKLSLDEAHQRGHFRNPASLSDVIASGCFLENGMIYDKNSGQAVSFLEGVNSGLIDSERKSIVNPRTNDVLSIRDALNKGLINSQGFYDSPDGRTSKSIVQALNQGDIKLVSEGVTFSKTGIKDTSTNQNISLSEALKRGVITPKGTFIDRKTQSEMSLQQAADRGFIDHYLVKELDQNTSLQDKTGQNISVLKAIEKGLILPDKGVVVDAKTGKSSSFQQAVSTGVLSSQDAMEILTLISPMITSTTILTQIQPVHEESVVSITISEATSRGLLDERTGCYTHPATGQTMPVEEAIREGFLQLSSSWPAMKESSFRSDEVDRLTQQLEFSSQEIKKPMPPPYTPAPTTVERSFVTKSGANYSFTTTTVSRPSMTQTVISEKRQLTIKSVVDPRTGQTFSVTDAMKKGLIDLTKGVYCDPRTGSTMPLNIAVEKGYIKADQMTEPVVENGEPIKETRAFAITGVIHPRTGERLSVSQAIREGILDQDNGLYHGLDESGHPSTIPISEAIQKGYVIAEDISTTVSVPGSLLRETKTFALKSVIHPVTGKQLSVAEAVAQGVIDESEGLYINPVTGKKMHIHEAIEKKFIDAELTSVTSNAEGDVNKITTTKLTTLAVMAVVDPRTGKLITVSQAIKDGILDHGKGIYYNLVTGETLPLNEAMDKNLVMADLVEANSSEEVRRSSVSSIHITEEQESFEATLVEDVHSETMTLSISSVIDPRTMEMVSYDDAVISGILNVKDGIYFNPASGETMPITLAMEKGLIHGEVTSKTVEEDTMRSSVTAEKPAFFLKCVTSVIDPRTGKQISVDKAIKDGLVNVEKGTFFDTRTREELSLEEALKQGFVNPSKHTDVDQMREIFEKEQRESEVVLKRTAEKDKPWSLVEMELEKTTSKDHEDSTLATEVLHYSTEIESHSPLNLSSDSIGKRTKLDHSQDFQPQATDRQLELSYDTAVKLGIISTQTGKVRDPHTGTMISFSEAISFGLIDQDKRALFDPIPGRSLTLKECIDIGLIKPTTGRIDTGKARAEGLLPCVQKLGQVEKNNLIDVVQNGLFDPKTGQILEPTSGKHYTLREGLINNTIEGTLVTVKNTQTGECVPLRKALLQGLIDGQRSLVWDKAANKKIPLPVAIERGLVQNVFDDSTGSVIDGTTGEHISFDRALADGKLPSDGVTVLDTRTGRHIKMEEALQKGLMDQSGHVVDQRGNKMSPQEALKMGLLAVVGAPILAGKMVVDSVRGRSDKSVRPAAGVVDGHAGSDFSQTEKITKPMTTIVYARAGDQIRPAKPSEHYRGVVEQVTTVQSGSVGRVSDSYDKLVQELQGEVSRIGNLEQLLKEDCQMGDETYKVKSQLETHKGMCEEIGGHQQRILSLVYQAEQLTEHYQEELTPEQVTELQTLATSLKARLEKVVKTSDTRLKHLVTAAEEIEKLEEEQTKMIDWLSTAEKELDCQEECMRRFEDLKPLAQKQQSLMSDVLAHQADLRFMSMASQKFLEEAKLHKLEVDAFKADRQRPARLSLISMEGLVADSVRDNLKDTTVRYQDLKNRCNSFGDRLQDLANKQRDYNDIAFKMLSWLTGAEDKLMSVRQESGSPDPTRLQEQLEKLKTVSNDAIGQGIAVDDLQKKGKDLTNSLSGISAEPAQVKKMQDTLTDITNRYTAVNKEVSEQVDALQAAITKSQGVQEAIDGLLVWIKDTDNVFRNQSPASLNQSNLNEQVQEFKTVQADVDNHKSSIDSVRQAARDLIKTCDLEMARALESRLNDIDKEYAAMGKKCSARDRDLEEISDNLREFHNGLEASNQWLLSTIENLESKDLSKLPCEEMKAEIDKLANEKNRRQSVIAELKKLGDQLVKDPRTGEVGVIKTEMANLDKNWSNLNHLLAQKEQEASLKEQKDSEFENAKMMLLLWLTSMEATADEFDPVAIEIETVEKQIAELQPLLEEFKDHGVKVDELNDLGYALEAMQSTSDRPLSPLRRIARNRRIPGLMSPRLRTPSPTFQNFPTSPTVQVTSPGSSESSGVSSRKSSSDNLLLDDLSETQQQLLDINQRYDIIGERLMDRQQELQNVLGSIKMFLQDLHDMLTWLDVKDREASYPISVPTNEKDAKKRLKEHEAFHRELLGKEGLVEDIRKKAQHLLRTKQGVPGLDRLQSQLSELDDKWHGLRATSEQRRKSLEDMVTDLHNLRENGEQLAKWLAQKEKMMDVLGPVATEPSLVQNQLDQVQVLKEEFNSQEPLYDQFIQSGHSILDKCDPDSRDSGSISRKMDSVSKIWDRLQTRLKDREASLGTIGGIGAELAEVSKNLGDWLLDMNGRLDSLPPVSMYPERQRKQAREMADLEQELSEKTPLYSRAKELCKQLCDKTKDSSTKADTRAKLARLEKGLSAVNKKIDSRRAALDSAGKEGEKFVADCQNSLAWIEDAMRNVEDDVPVSSDGDSLKKQAHEHKLLQQELSSKDPEILLLLDKGEHFLEQASPTMDTSQVAIMLQSIRSDWDTLKKAAQEKEEKLTETKAIAQKYQDYRDKMLLWLQLSEDKFQKTQPENLDKEAVGKKLKELQALQNDVLKKTHDHDGLNREGEALIEHVEAGKQDVLNQLEEINGRWDDLASGITERLQGLEDLQQRLAEVHDMLADTGSNLLRWEDKLDSHLKRGAASRDPKYFDKIKAVQEDVVSLQPQLEYLEALVDGMDVVDIAGGSNAAGLQSEISSIRSRQNQLQGKLGDLLSDMETGSQIVNQFQGLLKTVGSQLSELESEFNKMSPIGRDENTLDSQHHDVMEFLSRLGEKAEALNDVKKQAKELIDAGYISDPEHLLSQIDNLTKQHERLEERAHQRKADIESCQGKVQKVNDNLKKTRKELESAIDLLDFLKPIGGDVKAIKHQQDELKDVMKKKVDPLQKTFDTVTSGVQGLIQSAQPGVSTAELEADAEILAEKWSELNEKVSERERSLDGALLQSGKFKDALESLLAWLAETEEMVANQKPPSPEPRVVKAQLQEQKFLQKMLEDRSASVASVQETGSKVAAGVEGQEKHKIQTQMEQLDARWDVLNKKAADRMRMLEDMMKLAREFQDINEPLCTWLESGEKRFALLEPKALDAEGIKKLVDDLKTLESEIDQKDMDVHDLAMKGKSLQDYCKGEDMVMVQVKIDNVQKRYSDLKNKVEDTLEQMEEALPLAERFHSAHAKLLDWLGNKEPDLLSKQPAGQEAEEQVQVLLDQIEEMQPFLEVVNTEGGDLIDLAPGDTGLRIEDLISKDNKRFEAFKDQIEKRAEKVNMSRQKSMEVLGELDDLLEWFEEEEGKMLECEPISSEPGKLHSQLVDQKTMNDDINSQKSKARDAIAAGKKLIRENPMEDDGAIREKMDLLKQRSDAVARMSNDRLSQLEQAMPLAQHFLDTHNELVSWLDEIEPALTELEVMSISAEQVKKQQEKIKALKQDVADHKPTIDKVNKTGAALLKICGKADAAKIQDMLDDNNRRVEDVRNSVRDRSNSIDEALQQSAEFSDKLEDMVENLTSTSEQVENAEPISAQPDKLREQIGENKAIVEDMEMRQAALESVKANAEELLKQAGDVEDDAVKDVKQKLDELIKLYEDIKNNTQDRGQNLDDALEVAEKFWDDLNTLTGTLDELKTNVDSQEPPALEPEAINEQREELEALKDDIEATQADLKDVHSTGGQLMELVGEPEEVQKNLDDLDSNMASINDEYEKRSKTLEDALTKALHFQEELMKILVWLQGKEEEFCDFGPVASDFETIKFQWDELTNFKSEVDPKQVEVEALNQQANELVKDSSADQAIVVKEPLAEVNLRWDKLISNIGERQRLLQVALLNAGQFGHALKELMSWLAKTDQTLDNITPVYGDPKVIEIELAKLKIIQNDIQAHQHSVDSINDEAQKVIAAEGMSEAAGTKKKMDTMNKHWENILDKSAKKQEQLEEALREAQVFSGELQDILMRLGDFEGQLITSRPVGGLPETANEQLEKFMDVYGELDNLRGPVENALAKGEKLTQKTRDPAAANLRHQLQGLQQRWNHVKNRAGERKKKLEDAVGLAGNFHADLNKFIAWLTDTEKTLNNLNPVSRLVERVTSQIDDHRVLQKDVSKHREAVIALDKMGTHLKYFSQKQDVILIKNLLSSVHHRWEKIVSRSAERTRHLERGYKEAKQFCDMWKDLIDWLTEAQTTLDSDQFTDVEPDKIKTQISKHKEFQRLLGSKQPKFDTVNRAGRQLKEKGPPEDEPVIQQMLNEMKNRWNAVCGKSVDRQRKLEEALLLSGQFNDALQALLDWLARVEPTLSEDQPVHGDLDTVNSLLDVHKTFQQELGARTNNVTFVRKSAKELIDKSQEDTSQLQAQLIELSTMWDRTCRLSVSKQERLEQAHKLGEEFHKKAHHLLKWLADAERQLRYRGPVPDEEPLILQQMEEHKKFEESLMKQEANLRETLNIGQDIMKRCHPDAVSTMKHWLSVLRARWEEVTSWSKQRSRRLGEGLTNLRKNNSLLDELLAWLNGAEVKLTRVAQEPIPEDIQIIMQLIQEHQDFQNEMSSKQPEVDRLTKTDKRRQSSSSADVSSHIPILKGSARTPIKAQSRIDTGGRRTPDPGRRTPDSGRKTPEPQFRNPRVGALFNKWRQVWLMAMDRQRKLQDALDYLKELERMKNFDFDDWRKRYLRWMHHNKARIMDFFRRQDRDHDGKVTRKEFVEGILASKFPTSKMEMEAVANIFDKNGDGFIDYREFIAALRPDRETKPENDADKIQDEVKRQVHKCTCVRQFKIHKIGEGKYRFGDSQKLRLVRILRSTVMVRVGGGWIALDEFLVKNDPCRAKGRTNIELREQFILAQGVSQSMTGFISKSPVGSSHSGSSTQSGNNSWSSRSPSSASGPITKIREKTQHPSPWRQRVKTSPDGEVHQILSRTDPDGSRFTKTRVVRDLRSPRNVQSPASRSSSRASTGSRPPSRTGSEASDGPSEPEVFSTVQSETRNRGGRNQTTLTYQTHVLQTRSVTLPTSTTTTARGSKIPKFSPRK